MPANPADLAVLVIDDHMIIRQVVEQNLKNMGFSDIDTAASQITVQGARYPEKLEQMTNR